MAQEFDDLGSAIDLPKNIRLRVPGYSGTAASGDEIESGSRGLSTPVASPVLADNPELQAALSRNDLAEATRVEIQLDSRSIGGAGPATRKSQSTDIELEVPVPADDEIQVLLAEQDGVLSWHFSERAGFAGSARVRGAGAADVFRVPNRIGFAPAQTSEESRRGIIGALGKKILKIFVYKITDPLVENVSERIAEKFERDNRPYGLRMVTPDNYNRAESAAERWPVDWNLLSSGKALLLLHGTFSTAHGAFGSLDRETVQALYTRYGKRLFALNHYTMSEDPEANVKWLGDQIRNQLPNGMKLELDILCHSRGGLVARSLAEDRASLGDREQDVTVRRVVMVGVPNSGTVLADSDHMTDFIDRISNAVGLVGAASGPLALIGEFLDGALTIVKILGHGALRGLNGLASMDPGGKFVAAMNHRPVKSESYYAVTADYEPPPGNFKESITKKAGNAVVDAIFEQPNDLVVPTAGVYNLELGPAFPIPSNRLLQFSRESGVMHTTYFAQPGTRAQLSTWLTG
jgi:hypothetical protein